VAPTAKGHRAVEATNFGAGRLVGPRKEWGPRFTSKYLRTSGSGYDQDLGVMEVTVR
jgi:hypothetical protein